MYIVLAVVALVASASAKDLFDGEPGGVLAYERNYTASPTIWRQEKKVHFSVSKSEVITHIVIEDRREDKNGEAVIVEGGIGHQNVTIELKSPAVFRGFDFGIQIYVKKENNLQTSNDNDQQTVQDTQILQDTQVTDEKVLEKGSSVVTSSPLSTSTPAVMGQDKVQHPIVTIQEGNQEVLPIHDTQGQKTEQQNVQQSNDAQQSSVVHDKQSNTIKPLTKDEERQQTLDKIFLENKPAKTSTEAIKPTPEPAKPAREPTNPDSQQTYIHEPSQSFHIPDGGKLDQQTVKIQELDGAQQAKKQANVPLPYVNH